MILSLDNRKFYSQAVMAHHINAIISVQIAAAAFAQNRLKHQWAKIHTVITKCKNNRKVTTFFRRKTGTHSCEIHLATSAAICLCRTVAEVPTSSNSCQPLHMLVYPLMQTPQMNDVWCFIDCYLTQATTIVKPSIQFNSIFPSSALPFSH